MNGGLPTESAALPQITADLLATLDLIQIQALAGEFTDAGTTRDFDRFARLFTPDGTWHMPHIGARFVGQDAIRAAIEALHASWNFFVQTVHPGTVRITGDTATGRVYVEELGRMRDSSSHANHGVYHDRYRRVDSGWRFAERLYELRYVDVTPLAGSPPPLLRGD